MHLKLYILSIFLLAIVFTNANEVTISGSVYGENKSSLAFAKIHLIDASILTTTNTKGEFTVHTKKGKQKIIISYIGYVPDTLSIDVIKDTSLIFFLKPESIALRDVIVTASRSSKTNQSISVPVIVVNQEDIQSSGVIRLNEILEEQTGLQIVEDHGTGLQMQGLSADYIEILVDGEPIIGRNAGTLDLRRISVNNIDKIEIIKGPVSSLYGSDALAGVINIITSEPINGWNAETGYKFRSYNTHDLNLAGGYKNNKLSVQSSFNRLSSSGYDLQPESIALTSPKFKNYSARINMGFLIKERSKLSLSSDVFNETQLNQESILIDSDYKTGTYTEQVFNTSAKATYKYWSKKGHQIQITNRFTLYDNVSEIRLVEDNSDYSYESFKQILNSTYGQFDLELKRNIQIISGAGLDYENVFSSRYNDEDAFVRGYFFSQLDWTFQDRLFLSTGFRFDGHSIYKEQFSPKTSIKYMPLKWLSFKASIGSGYKAPDFRQLVLNFTNPIVGYSVFGNYLVKESLSQLEEQGLIASYLIDPESIAILKNEVSWAFNGGFAIEPNSKFMVEGNWFRNQINNLIETSAVARKTNGQNVFTYFNINKVITQGIETNIKITPIEGFQITAGYQFLDTKDLDAVKKYKNGEIIGRGTDNIQRKYNLSEYGGLYNKSKHTANLKIIYTNEKYDFSISVRNLYRGKFGFGDINNSGYLDDEREYAKGYYNLDITLQKELFEFINILFSIDNITNATNEFLPSMPGRIYTMGISFQLNNNLINKLKQNNNETI
ncbi:MAG: TonB-dependent receptor [Bacteroidetes bacterium]|nr:TonB-dependent receptor [Bacteroidota bacterium]